MIPTETDKKLKKIKEEVINCKKCSLYRDRIDNKYYPVIGEGNHQAKVIFIGEAPGANEAKTGRPFCGASGKILDKLLESVGIERKDIYIANILKCRPPNNRNPKTEEIFACVPYLEKQIEIIKPRLICPLGNYSTAFILEKYGLKDEIQGISKIHGKLFKAKASFGKKEIIPFYHPAVAVYNANMKEILEKDFQILKSFI